MREPWRQQSAGAAPDQAQHGSRTSNNVTAAAAHAPIATGSTIASDNAATTEITIALPAADARGGVATVPEKTDRLDTLNCRA